MHFRFLMQKLKVMEMSYWRRCCNLTLTDNIRNDEKEGGRNYSGGYSWCKTPEMVRTCQAHEERKMAQDDFGMGSYSQQKKR
jgi:hypothetical protein